MNNNNKNKAEKLGMPIGTASNRLRKTLLFSLVKELDRDVCYHCGKKIETIEEFSIEHKIPWLNSDKPVELFFDLNNIAFSHLSCNIKEADHTKGIVQTVLTCSYCGKVFERENWQVTAKNNRGQSNFYCSRKCAGSEK